MKPWPVENFNGLVEEAIERYGPDDQITTNLLLRFNMQALGWISKQIEHSYDGNMMIAKKLDDILIEIRKTREGNYVR